MSASAAPPTRPDCYVKDEQSGTVWPVPWGTEEVNGVEWRLRYGSAPDLFAASCLAAYSALLDPSLTLTEATERLRRARRAVKGVACADRTRLVIAAAERHASCSATFVNDPPGWTCLDQLRTAADLRYPYGDKYRQAILNGERLCDGCDLRAALDGIEFPVLADPDAGFTEQSS